MCCTHILTLLRSFNPPPAHPPEETAGPRPGRRPGGVSTRLRLIRRRKRPAFRRTPFRAACFNPPPAHPPEETLAAAPGPATGRRFQPASGSSAGGNEYLSPSCGTGHPGFNPPPAHPPEETWN